MRRNPNHPTGPDLLVGHATARRRSTAPRIAVNGCYLDEVRTRIEYKYHANSIAFLSHPTGQHQAIIHDANVIIKMPTVTALQLYFDGVLPADRTVPVTLCVGRKNLGRFLVAWLRQEDSQHARDNVFLCLSAAPDLANLGADSGTGESAHEN